MPTKGYKQTQEHREKRALKLSGRILSLETRNRIALANLGKQKSPESKIKMSKSKLGHPVSKETGKKISLSKMGKKRPDMTGKNNWNWIEDRSLLQKSNRNGKDFACSEWRMLVYKRDGFKCKMNNKDCCKEIEAHHILPWRDYPELRYDVNNGITLCRFHHPRGKNDEDRLSPYLQKLVTNGKIT